MKVDGRSRFTERWCSPKLRMEAMKFEPKRVRSRKRAVMVRCAVRTKVPELTVRKECLFERLVALSGVLLLKQRKVDVVDHTRAK
jgi:hypothetical protein